jgi:hypothetical protein
LIARVAADALVVAHLAFVLFVVAGGTLALRWPRSAFVHLPAVAWGVYAEVTSTICPLTPLENAFRAAAGQAGYAGGFIEHYLIPLLYPAGLAPVHQRWIAAFVIAVNASIYLLVALRARGRRSA